MERWRCGACDSIVEKADLLKAVNPFQSDLYIYGCPDCKDVQGFTLICDEPGCTNDATCGFPVPDGYRTTCGDHMRAAAEVIADASVK